MCLISACTAGGSGVDEALAATWLPKPVVEVPNFKSGTLTPTAAAGWAAAAGEGGIAKFGVDPVSVLLPNIEVFPYFFFIMGSFCINPDIDSFELLAGFDMPVIVSARPNISSADFDLGATSNTIWPLPWARPKL